tara:strand:- start:145 stop:792 length:648 start_codon:yes stop_codon:yes gene_type:complete
MKVLDKGFVHLVDAMGNDLSVVNAARISFGRESDSMDDKDRKLLRYLWDHQHTSPFRHASLQFHIKAPLFVLRQWMKHQVGCAWNEISGRYVKFNPEFYVPSTWREQHPSNKQGSQGEIADSKSAEILYESNMKCAVEDYYELLAMGVCKEQARMVLPLSLYSECYWTASLQAVMHFLKLREDEHSQKEIRDYAHAVRVLAQKQFPEALKVEQHS